MDAPEVFVSDEPVIAIDHPRFRTAWRALFTRRVTPNCMTHDCTTVETGVMRHDTCCQYGADVDLAERDKIEAKRAEIAAVLHPEVRDLAWFDDEVWADADYPSGKVVRSRVHGVGCLFLQHDNRGCGIHRAALENGLNVGDIKPAICRLFPMSYIGEQIIIAEEFPEYSCAHVDGPTIYRYARADIGEVFGADLVAALDAAESAVLASEPPPPPAPLRPAGLSVIR